MKGNEKALVLLVFGLVLCLFLSLAVPLLESRINAQHIESVGVLKARELQIVDESGKTWIRMGVNNDGASIEILNRDGEVVWKAPPDEEAPAQVSGSMAAYTGSGGSHWVQTVLEQGRIIILEDSSRWEVEPIGQAESILWTPTSPITVSEGGSLRYVLTNTETATSVTAKFQGKR